MEHKLKLSERLNAIADYIEPGASVADIGTDHGHLPVYLAQNGLASSIIASDISAGSLEAALKSASKYGVKDSIQFIVAPGLSGICRSDADTVVLAGMGGETIASILEGARWPGSCGVRLVLQPQSKIGELCSCLREYGFVIVDAKLVRDDGRLYVVMLVTGGVADFALEPEMELYARMIRNDDPLFAEYIDNLIDNAHHALAGMKYSGTEYPKILKKLAMYSSLKEVCKNANRK